MTLVNLTDIEAARSALPAIVRHTPAWPFATDSADYGRERLFLKLENLQPTGSYKLRAAFVVLSALLPEQRDRGVVLASTGNFAQAFALAGRHLGIATCIVMLTSVDPGKIDATLALGAEVDLFDGPFTERQGRVEEIGDRRGMTVIDTREDPSIIVGHGSIGLELIDDVEGLAQVLVPVSSGGLAAGVAAAIKQIDARIKVIGVQPSGANAAFVSRAAGCRVVLPKAQTCADAMCSTYVGALPFAHLQAYLDDIVLVEEREIARAHMKLRHEAKFIAEAAGGVASAAFFSGKVDVSLKTAAIVSGGNIADANLPMMEALAD